MRVVRRYIPRSPWRYDLEEPDRDPDRVLVRPRRGQVHDPLHLLGTPVRMLPAIRIVVGAATVAAETLGAIRYPRRNADRVAAGPSVPW